MACGHRCRLPAVSGPQLAWAVDYDLGTARYAQSIGRTLKLLREQSSLNNPSLVAAHLQIPTDKLIRWEEGEEVPKREDLDALVEAYCPVNRTAAASLYKQYEYLHVDYQMRRSLMSANLQKPEQDRGHTGVFIEVISATFK